MSLRAAIFDMDGVLADFDLMKINAYFMSLLPINAFEIVAYFKKWSKNKNFPKTLSEEKKFLDDFWSYLAQEFNLTPDLKAKLLQPHYTDFIFAYPEVKDVLSTLRKQNIKIGILSNFLLASMEASLTVLEFNDLIDVVGTAITLGHPKPQAKAYLNMINKLKLSPEECIFFDDDIENIKGAEAIGMQAYWVKRDQSEQDIEHHIICDLTPIPNIFLKKMI